MPKSKNIHSDRHDFYVLVRGIGEFGDRPIECFSVTGEEAFAQVKKVEEDLRKRGKAPFPCIYVKGKYAETGTEERWKDAWRTWRI
jgi:hypothetical protein